MTRPTISLAMLLGTLAIAGCGIGFAVPDAPKRDLDPLPDGLVLEPAIGETAGTSWAFGVYRSDAQVCTYVVSDAVMQGPGCGPSEGPRALGPFGVGGTLADEWTYVGGVAGRDVATVRVVLEGGQQLDLATLPIDDTGVDAGAFFAPLEPGVVVAVVVALDEQGRELERVPIGPLDVPAGPQLPPPSG